MNPWHNDAGTATAGLTEAQVRQFKEQGYLVLHDFVEPEHVAHWRVQVARYAEQDPERPDSWSPPGLRVNRDAFEMHPPERALRNLPQMRAVVEQLGGGAFGGGMDQLILNWPEQDGRPWTPPRHGHIDLIHLGMSWRFSLGVTTYLYEVEHGGGAFCVWPGSHLPVWRYFQQHPGEYAQTLRPQARADMEHAINQCVSGQPVEVTAGPGAVILWHAFLLHEASRNVRARPRVGLFYRFGAHLRPDEPVETFGDPWEHWAI